MSTPTVLVHRDPDELAAAVAARLITRLVDVQSARGAASVVLTGGVDRRTTLEAVAASPARGAVDWRRLDVWWGDERFLPSGDPERNETQAREALLDAVPLDPDAGAPDAGQRRPRRRRPGGRGRAVRRRAGPGGAARGPRPGAVVRRLPARRRARTGTSPRCSPSTRPCTTTRPVLAVRNSPKPPPTRISLGFAVIQGSREVWVVVAGEDKAKAVALALSGRRPSTRCRLPAAHGRDRTLWLLDKAAAGRLPALLGRIASP